MSDSNLPVPPVEHDRAYVEMMKLFEDLSFSERIKRTINGINQPKDSGEYKFAVLQLQRMTGPFLAIVLPIIAVAFLLTIETTQEFRSQVVAVEVIDPTDTPEIEEEPPPLDCGEVSAATTPPAAARAREPAIIVPAISRRHWRRRRVLVGSGASVMARP